MDSAVRYLSQSFQTLLLGVRVDIEPDNEPYDVEKWNPGVLWQELLGKSQRERRADPADLHDRHETSPHSCTHLVVSARTSNQCHRSQINSILNGRYLQGTVVNVYSGPTTLKRH